jgi:hypothetical protein
MADEGNVARGFCLFLFFFGQARAIEFLGDFSLVFYYYLSFDISLRWTFVPQILRLKLAPQLLIRVRLLGWLKERKPRIIPELWARK